MADHYVHYLPIIAASDFEPFREIMHDNLHDAYDKWLKLFAKWREEYGGVDSNIVEVHVNPDEFSRFVTTERHRNDLNTLLMFSEIVGKR